MGHLGSGAVGQWASSPVGHLGKGLVRRWGNRAVRQLGTGRAGHFFYSSQLWTASDPVGLLGRGALSRTMWRGGGAVGSEAD